MKKIVFTVLMVLACTAGQGQILYRISGKGLKKPSYIVGTYHLAPSTFVDSIPGARAAFAAVDQVYGEVDMLETLEPENMKKMQAAMMLPEGTTLSSLLDKDQMGRLNAILREVMGVDMNNEAVAAQLDPLSPSTLQTQLALLVYMKNMQGAVDITSMIDTYFQQEAVKAGKIIGGLESAEFQMEVLYGASLEEQVKSLMCFVDNFQDGIEMADFITAAYFAQDLEQLEELNLEEQEDECSNPEDNEKLLYGRNANWVEQMPAIMNDKPTLFVVGAFHLCGERGVLKMLEAQGYTVEGVKK
ncbi:MAG: TraB/GumN family protein [Bacteroidales bacterium]|nr:TraB/GumN family protein [Bacteroidales bacterium]